MLFQKKTRETRLFIFGLFLLVALVVGVLTLVNLFRQTATKHTSAVPIVTPTTTTPLKFNPETFEWVPISDLPNSSLFPVYRVTGRKVYAGETLLPTADPLTFLIALYQEGTSTGYTIYSKDKDHVFRYDPITVDPVSIIHGADPSTFVPMYSHLGSADGQYAKDKNLVYFIDDPIAGADPDTFVPLLVTLQGSELSVASGYSKDARSVYYIDIHTYKVLSSADPRSFTLEFDERGHWAIGDARDSVYRWHEGNRMQ